MKHKIRAFINKKYRRSFINWKFNKGRGRFGVSEGNYNDYDKKGFYL